MLKSQPPAELLKKYVDSYANIYRAMYKKRIN